MNKLSAAVVVLALCAAPALADKRVDEAAAKCEEQIRKGKPEEAIKIVQKLASQDPGNIEAQILMGRILGRVGSRDERDEAGKVFARAVELAGAGPMQAPALVALASYELQRASSAQALTHAEAAVKAQPSTDALATLAMAQARAADPSSALQTAERAVQTDATSGLAQQARGEALLALERADDAVAAFRKATELAPASASAKVGLAFALVAAGKAKEAVEIARGVTVAEPKSAEAFAALALALIKANPQGWSEAIAEAQNGAFNDGASPIAQFVTGQLFEQNNNFDQAEAAYREALKTDPRFGPAALALVQLKFRMGKKAEAAQMAPKLAESAPGSGRIQLLCGDLLLRNDESAKALPYLEKAVKLLPNSAEASYFLGYAETLESKVREAVAPLARAVELAPNNVDYRALYGYALGRANEPEKAVAELLKVVASPNYKGPDAWINLGLFYRSMSPRKPLDAIDAYKKALALAPDNAQASYGLALSLYFADRWDEAIAAFQKAAQLDANVKGEAAVQIAKCTFRRDLAAQKKDFTQSEAAYQQAVQVAGVDNAILQAVRKNIDEAKKRTKLGPASPAGEFDVDVDVNRWARVLMGGGKPAEKLRAIAELKKVPRDGAPYVAFALREDTDPDVSDAALSALESMKGAACVAIKDLKPMATAECPPPCTNCPRADMEREMRVCDSIRKGRAFYLRLAPTCGGR